MTASPGAERYDVAIVGAGPTGLALAALLAQSGAKVILLEKRATPHTIPRAIAYDPETLRLFQTLGVLKTLSPTLKEDLPVEYLGRKGQLLSRIDQFPRVYGHSDLGAFYQPELEQTLNNHIETLPNVDFRRGWEAVSVAQDELSTRLRVARAGGEDVGADAHPGGGEAPAEHEIHADYLVACDGAGSRIREALGFDFNGFSFLERWIVVDTCDDGDPDPRVRFFCDPARPAMTMPVSKNRRRWEFMVLDGDDPDEIASEPSVRALMAHRGADPNARIERSVVYAFHARFAERFRKGRVFLAGDAAHVMPPFAGQGLNSGMRDAANLAWKLAAVTSGRCGPALLQTYEAERRGHVEDMTRLAAFLGRVIMPTSPWRAAIRDAVFQTLWAMPWWRRLTRSRALLPYPTLGESTLTKRATLPKKGQMIPQPTLRRGDGSSVLLDDYLGTGFTALGLGCDPETSLHREDLAVLRALDAGLASLDVPGAPADAAGGLRDWRGKGRKIAILRPDRFAAMIFAPTPGRPQLGWMRSAYDLT